MHSIMFTYLATNNNCLLKQLSSLEFTFKNNKHTHTHSYTHRRFEKTAEK